MSSTPQPMQPPAGAAEDTTDHEVRGLFMIIGCGGLIVFIAVVTTLWVVLGDRSEREAERERRAAVENALAVGTSATIRDLVADQGFHTLRDGGWPKIPYPENLDSRGRDWAAVLAHGDQHRPSVVPDLGVIVRVEGTAVSLDPSHHALPEYLRADEPAAMQWVALLRRTIVADAYAYQQVQVDVEEVDLRMIRVSDGVLIAQGTYRAIPPLEQSFPQEVYQLSEQAVADWVGDAWNTARQAWPFEPDPPLNDPVGCPVDGALAPLSIDPSVDPSCEIDPAGAEACRAHCLRGHPESCNAVARALQSRDPEAETDELYYLRACHYGLATGCTNWAVGQLSDESHEPTPDPESDPWFVCLARVFAHACDMDDDWGCAMLEQMRMEGEGHKRAPAAARAALEARCDAAPSAACYVLGRYQARGAFGLEERARADESFRRACESGGVPSACDARADQWELDLLERSGASD